MRNVAKTRPGISGKATGGTKKTLHTTSDTSIPVIVYFSNDVEKDQKDDVIHACQMDNNSIDSDLGFDENAVCGHLTSDMIRKIKDYKAVNRIFYDREINAFLDIATKEIGARAIQEQLGLTGKGIHIAVVDTGIYPHQDLTKDTNRIVAFKDFVNDKNEPYDDNGHGTHCAGDAAGNGLMSDGKYTGPASGASLIGVKVLDKNGGGRLSAMLKGIAWCIKHKEEYNIRIISLSLGAKAYDSYRDDPLSQAVQSAWHQGIIVCAAAGNDGPKPKTINTPAVNPFIITVGAASDQNTETRADDVIADYSSRGPTIDSLIKPDLYAPGTDIISLLAPGSTIEKQRPEQIVDENICSYQVHRWQLPFAQG